MSADVEVISGELMPADATRTLFRTDDPIEVLEVAKGIAKALGPALKEGGMLQRIGQSDHVKIEGWQTLGGMVGVTPHTIWSRPLAAGNGWEAQAEARTLDGRVVGTADGMCSRDERNWKRSEDQEIRSMAQTRAMSKALAAPLRFIVTLSGLSGTPAEEFQDAHPYGESAPRPVAQSMRRAVEVLYGTDELDTAAVVARLEQDAGGYLPRVVARAVMLLAAHRPGRAGAVGAGVEGTVHGDIPTGTNDDLSPKQEPTP